MSLHLVATLRIVRRNRRGRRLAEDVDIWHPTLLGGLQRGEQFVRGTREIRPAIGHAFKFWRQLRANCGPENRHHDVAGRRFQNLRLKSTVGLVETCFPANGLKPDKVFVFAVQLGRDRLRPSALRRYVARRRHEYANNSHAICHALASHQRCEDDTLLR